MENILEQYKTPTIINSCILAAIVILYVISLPIISNTNFIIVLFILFCLFLIFGQKYITQEEFSFKVSPEKQKCMEENVSTNQPPATRSSFCCNVTERGGTLPFIEDWKKHGWDRTDNWVDTTDNNSYQTQLPPTSLVD